MRTAQAGPSRSCGTPSRPRTGSRRRRRNRTSNAAVCGGAASPAGRPGGSVRAQREGGPAGEPWVPPLSGGGGIRTHGALRLNGFQDRPVRPLRNPASGGSVYAAREPDSGCGGAVRRRVAESAEEPHLGERRREVGRHEAAGEPLGQASLEDDRRGARSPGGARRGSRRAPRARPSKCGVSSTASRIAVSSAPRPDDRDHFPLHHAAL